MAVNSIARWMCLVGGAALLAMGGRLPVDTLTMLDVGAGLAVLFTDHQGWQMLYDAGPGRAVLPELGRTLPPWDNQLDLLVISHAHRDHLEGAVAVLAAYQIKEVWLPDQLGENDFTRALQDALKNEGATIRHPKQGWQRRLPSGWQLTVWHPAQTLTSTHAHAATLVIAGTHPRAPTWLLTGDLERRDETDILSYCSVLPSGCAVNILQVSHHGSRTTTREDWLQATAPALALISTGENSYGHPHPETLQRLEQEQIPTRRTDRTGRIRVVLRWPLQPP